MRKSGWRKIIGTLIGIVLLPLLWWTVATLEIPPLLRSINDAGRGGYTNLCPPLDDNERILSRMPLAECPILTNRLKKKFPTGTREQVLLDELNREGFQQLPPCKSDTSTINQNMSITKIPIRDQISKTVKRRGVHFL